MMPRYLVVTPEYGSIVPITDEGEGPLEYQADVIEIEADTPRDAKALGVKVMLQPWRGQGPRFRWCRYQRSDGLSPYAGVMVVLVPAPLDNLTDPGLH